MLLQEGEKILDARARASAVAWERYETHAGGRKVLNQLVVNGRMVEVTWRSLIMDQEPVRDVQVKEVSSSRPHSVCVCVRAHTRACTF